MPIYILSILLLRLTYFHRRFALLLLFNANSLFCLPHDCLPTTTMEERCRLETFWRAFDNNARARFMENAEDKTKRKETIASGFHKSGESWFIVFAFYLFIPCLKQRMTDEWGEMLVADLSAFNYICVGKNLLLVIRISANKSKSARKWKCLC